MRRSLRVMAAALLVSLSAVLVAAPAHAGTVQTASMDTAGCPAGQYASSVRVILTNVPQWQKVTVQTDAYPVTRDHSSYEGGVGFYYVPIGGKLNTDAPATAWISDDNWSGSFSVIGVSCHTKAAAELNVEGTGCGVNAQINVSVSNPNDIKSTYRIGGGLPGQDITLLGGESTTLTYGAERGQTYEVTAYDNSDGIGSSARVTVPACQTPNRNESANTSAPQALRPPATTPANSASSTPTRAPKTTSTTSPSPSASATPSDAVSASGTSRAEAISLPSDNTEMTPDVRTSTSMEIISAIPASNSIDTPAGWAMGIVIIFILLAGLASFLRLQQRKGTSK